MQTEVAGYWCIYKQNAPVTHTQLNGIYRNCYMYEKLTEKETCDGIVGIQFCFVYNYRNKHSKELAKWQKRNLNLCAAAVAMKQQNGWGAVLAVANGIR